MCASYRRLVWRRWQDCRAPDPYHWTVVIPRRLRWVVPEQMIHRRQVVKTRSADAPLLEVDK